MQSILDAINQYPDVIVKSINLAFQMTSQTGEKYDRGMPDPALNKYFLMTRYLSAKLAIMKFGTAIPTIASIVGVDGEYPLKREAFQFSTEKVGSVKIARARLFTESDFDLIRDADLHLRAQDIAVYNAFLEEYLQIPAFLTKTIVCLCTILLLQLFTSGQATYIDPDTGLGFELSYLPYVPASNRPLALTGTNLWTDTVNSKPLENLRDHLNAYYLNVYRYPTGIGMSSLIADSMLAANDTKVKIARMNGAISLDATDIAGLPRPTLEQVKQWIRQEGNSILQTSGNFDFVISDAFYYWRNDAGLQQTPYFSTDTYAFINENLIEGAYVPTATNDYASTLAFSSEVLSKAPRREKVSVDTKFLAICNDPRYLGWRKVI